MATSPYVRANAADQAHRWRTFTGKRVLALARTFTSAVRVLEALAVFRGDSNVLVAFACDDSTAFNAGTEPLLTALQACLLPWESRLAVAPDLVVTATENVDVAELPCPVVVLPHGIGFHKFVPDHRTDEVRLSGVPRPEFQHERRLHLVLSHPDQRRQLREARVPLADWAPVVGDPARDRLAAGHRMRDQYREALGVSPEQRLVVVTSTWGGQSLIGTRPGLPVELLGALPHDSYRVAAVLHPNVWFAHSPWQVRHLLADALDAGLLLIPPEAGWGATLVAADCVVGDHGSVTLYAASLGHPVLLAAHGAESVPGTAMAMLADGVPRLAGSDLRAQVETAVEEHDPDRHRAAVERAFAHPGEGLRRLIDLLYGLLGVAPPEPDAADLSLPDPEPDGGGGPPLAFDVRGALTGQREITLERFPAASRAVPAAPPGVFRHLSAYESERRNALATTASVICQAPNRLWPGERWAEQTLGIYPGALMAARPHPSGAAEVTVRGRGAPFLVESDTPLPLPLPLAAGAVHTLLRAGEPVPGPCKLRVGPAVVPCEITRSADIPR